MSLLGAVHENDIEKCEELIKNGACVDESYGQYPYLSPYGLALFYGYDNIAIFLSTHTTTIIKPNMFYHLVEKNYWKVIKFCLKNTKLFTNYIDENGRPLLHYAIEMGATESLNILLKYGTNPNIKNIENGITSLCIAITAPRPKKEILELLLEYGSNFSIYDQHFNCTAFHYALKYGKKDMADLFRKHVEKRREKEYLVVFAAREFDAGSLLHRDYLPFDLFKLIFSQVWIKFNQKN